MRRDLMTKEQAAVGCVAGASLGELKPMCSGILFSFCLHCDCTVGGESQRASPLRAALLYSCDVVTIAVGV